MTQPPLILRQRFLEFSWDLIGFHGNRFQTKRSFLLIFYHIIFYKYVISGSAAWIFIIRFQDLNDFKEEENQFGQNLVFFIRTTSEQIFH